MIENTDGVSLWTLSVVATKSSLAGVLSALRAVRTRPGSRFYPVAPTRASSCALRGAVLDRRAEHDGYGCPERNSSGAGRSRRRRLRSRRSSRATDRDCLRVRLPRRIARRPARPVRVKLISAATKA